MATRDQLRRRLLGGDNYLMETTPGTAEDTIARIRGLTTDMEAKSRLEAAREKLRMDTAKSRAMTGTYQNPELTYLGNAEQNAAAMDRARGGAAPGQQIDPRWLLGGVSVSGQGLTRGGGVGPASASTSQGGLRERLAMLSGAGGQYQDGSTPFEGSDTRVAVRPNGRIALIGSPDRVDRQAAYEVAAGAKGRLQQAREERIKANLARMEGSPNPAVRQRAAALAQRLGIQSDSGAGTDPMGNLKNTFDWLVQQQRLGNLSPEGARAALSAIQQQQQQQAESAIREREIATRKEMADAANAIKERELAQTGTLRERELAQTREMEAERLRQQQEQFDRDFGIKREEADWRRSPEGQRSNMLVRGVEPEVVNEMVPPPQTPGTGPSLPKAMTDEQKMQAIQRFQNFGLSNPGVPREQMMAMLDRLGLTTEDLRTYRNTLNPPSLSAEQAFENPGILNSVTRWWNQSDAPRYDQRRRARSMLDALLGG